MSRFIEECLDGDRKYLLTTLNDPEVCLHQYNDVCCNADNWERVGGFTLRHECIAGACPYFTAEPVDELDALKEGVRTYGNPANDGQRTGHNAANCYGDEHTGHGAREN